MYCMLTQYYEIAELMLAHSPEVIDIGDKYGKSALHIAVQVGSVECVKVMLQVNTNYYTTYSCTGGISRVRQGHASGKHKLLRFI